MSYSLQVSLMGQIANLTVGQVTKFNCKASVSLAKNSYTKLSSPRSFEVSLAVEILPQLSASVFNAELKAIKVTGIRLLSDTQEIPLTATERQEYLTYSNLFLQLKHKLLVNFVQKQTYDLDSSSVNPLQTLTSKIKNKAYSLSFQNNEAVIEVSSS